MRVIDSHTAGEPTRVVVEGGPDLGVGSMAERAALLQSSHAEFCRSILCEPRGHDAFIGALLVPPSDPDCVAGVIFFNTLQNLGMCGHASIGLAVTLAHLGVISPGTHKIDTPVGIITIDLHDSHTVSVANVESYRLHKAVRLEVPGLGEIKGDVAWGGNWFFLVKDLPIDISEKNIRSLTDTALAIRKALERDGITGRDGAWIDHIELFGPPTLAAAKSKNFVLCPGGAFDRSPCGTGCSAKMACLAADQAWPAATEWIQESVIGSTYAVHYHPTTEGKVITTVKGQAFVTSEALLNFDLLDPYRSGITF